MSDKASVKEVHRARKDVDKAVRRDEILDAAEVVIGRKGWDPTNYGDVAKQAGLSRALVYVYFPERNDLFHGVCARGLAALQARFEAAIKRHKTGIEQVMALGRAYYAFSIEETLYFELLSKFHAQEMEEGCNPDPAQERGQGCLMQVAMALGNGLADGTIREGIGDPRSSAVAIWAFTHGLIQISSRKEAMLKHEFDLTTAKMMEHGFGLLRGSLERL
jgi:AcrR family transcriptional regulator